MKNEKGDFILEKLTSGGKVCIWITKCYNNERLLSIALLRSSMTMSSKT